MLSDFFQRVGGKTFEGLNPCSNGICSLTYYQVGEEARRCGLNPCSNGICSLTQ